MNSHRKYKKCQKFILNQLQKWLLISTETPKFQNFTHWFINWGSDFHSARFCLEKIILTCSKLAWLCYILVYRRQKYPELLSTFDFDHQKPLIIETLHFCGWKAQTFLTLKVRSLMPNVLIYFQVCKSYIKAGLLITKNIVPFKLNKI